MNDVFEDQLRADLHTAAGRAAYDSIDPTEVIGEGRRVVRRRHRLQALGAAAAVAAIGVGGFLATDTDRTTTAPPAAPSTSAPPLNRAVLNLTDDGSARFLAELDRDRTTVRVLDASGSSRPVVATLRAPGPGERFDVTTAAVPGTGTVVGLLPTGGHLLKADTDAPSREGGYRSDAQRLGPDLTIFAVRFDDAARVTGEPRILWSLSGEVWDGSRSLPTALFDPPDGSSVPQLVWVDDANQTWGTSDPVGGTLSEKPLEPWTVNSMGSFEPAGSANAGRGTFVITGLLPDVDASKLSATWAPGVTVHTPLRAERLATAPGQPASATATNLTAFHAVITTDGELPEPLLRSITFTGPDGKQHGHSYPAGSKG